MSQRCILGIPSLRPIAVVREHGSRVECIGLVDWFIPQTLERIASYWVGDCNQYAWPEDMVTHS